ncbi:DUF4181 domain-containing protein [Ornithinibacillus xuwenensis]|uniref:DUF4181 domain-containing protein n=1 Tax=Ornithinibacillus xuwenensis TaxID=3144668 RepID=A0ABU9XKI3_9BACI
MGKIGLISLIIAITYLILRKIFVGDESNSEKDNKSVPEERKYIELWGSIILAVIAIPIVIFIDVKLFKCFLIIFMIAIFSFHSYIDWKYRKGSKLYIVSIITMVIGILLAYFIL